MKKTAFWRWTFYLSGMIILAFGIGMTIRGERFGIGPWDVLHYGLTKQIGLTIGMWSIITGFLIILVTSIWTRSFPKIGTWLNMLVIGTFIDISLYVLPEVTTFGSELAMFTFGVIVMGIGIGIYVAPNLGAGPRDSIMLLLMERFNMSVRTARTVMEVLVAVVGWLLGGPVGIGTVMIAFGLGSFVAVAMPYSKGWLARLIDARDVHLLESS